MNLRIDVPMTTMIITQPKMKLARDAVTTLLAQRRKA